MARGELDQPVQDRRQSRDWASGAAREAATKCVSVIIPCFNQAEYLDEAIRSVLAQSFQDFEVLVVDDGSTDATPEVARRHSQVRYFKQANRGLPAARNAGIAASNGRYLVFLDADDRLLPQALVAGLRCYAGSSECAFVSGGHRRIDEAGLIIEWPTPARIENDHYLALLRGNYVGMHAAVMYRRACVKAVGGFAEELPACEDYDLYLRLARLHPVRCHDTVVAEYRTHPTSMSANTALMLSTVLRVLRSQEPYLDADERRRGAFAEGLRYWKRLYVRELLEQLRLTGSPGVLRNALRDVSAVIRHAPHELSCGIYFRWVRPALPTSLLRLVARIRGAPYYPAQGRIRFGDLRRVTPISAWFGADRGLPIDRYYIEAFLATHSNDIRGRVLEIGDPSYTRRFGGDRVSRSDVLHVHEQSPWATFVGDLADAAHVPSDAFDCVIVTQTLHLIYDIRAAVATLVRILRPGGVLLLTVPGISQIGPDQWGRSWYWTLTPLSTQRMLQESPSLSNISVTAYGNVLAASAFLQGVAVEELTLPELDYRDPQYAMLIVARATKMASPCAT